MVRAIATLSICCILGGGILLGTVESVVFYSLLVYFLFVQIDEQTTADMPRIPQIADLSNFNDKADTLTENKDVVLKTENRASVKTESVKTETASKTVDGRASIQ